jgi:hypothetical protein
VTVLLSRDRSAQPRVSGGIVNAEHQIADLLRTFARRSSPRWYAGTGSWLPVVALQTPDPAAVRSSGLREYRDLPAAQGAL